MLAFFVAIFIVLTLVTLAGYLSYMVLRSAQALPIINQHRLYLPSDFFVSLVLFGNFWMILLVLLGSQELLPSDRPLIVIIVSLIAPFLSWWHKKKAKIE